MGPDNASPNLLLDLAGAGIAPLIGGCVGGLAAGPFGGLVGAVVGGAAEKVIERFGGRIVASWWGWFNGRPPADREEALAQVACLSPEEARRQAEDVVERVAPDASAQDRALAAHYLAAIPAAVQQSTGFDRASRKVSSLASSLTARADGLVHLLPHRVPPYAVPCELPGSGYLLDELLGMGGFGAVYLARLASEPYSPARALKFCLDPALLPSLRRERDLLDRLQAAGRQSGSESIVRLYGYNLDYPDTPYLVYEYVPGGDLAAALAQAGEKVRRPDWPAVGLKWVRAIAGGLAFAHAQGLVHRDLKPANVLVDGERLKLADFGIGGVAAAQALERSRLAAGAGGSSSALQSDLFRGSGTWLYMSPEQKRGDPPDPRQDVYSLGVLWYQVLLGQVSHEMHPGWEDDLEERGVPEDHRALIRRCVGGLKGRPADGAELVRLLQGLSANPPPAPPPRRREPEVILDALPARPPSAPTPRPTGERGRPVPRPSSAPADRARGGGDGQPRPGNSGPAPVTVEPEAPRAGGHSSLGAVLVVLLLLVLVGGGMAGFVWLQSSDEVSDRRKGTAWDSGSSPTPPTAPRDPVPPIPLGTIPVVPPLRTYSGHGEEVTALAFSPRGSEIASASKDQAVEIWDARTGERRFSTRIEGTAGARDWVTSLAYSPDGTRIAAGCFYGRVRAIDPRTGKLLKEIGFLGSVVHRVAFSPDGTYLAAGGEGKTVKVWDLRGGNEVTSFDAFPEGQITALGFTSNGLTLATGSRLSHRVTWWLTSDGKEAGTLDAHPGGVGGLAWGKDDQLATGGGDRVVRIWNYRTRAVLQTLKGHTGRVTDVAYSPDGSQLVSSGAEGGVLVWDPRTGKQLYSCGGLNRAVPAVAFGSDGNLIAAASGELVVVWEAEQTPSPRED